MDSKREKLISHGLVLGIVLVVLGILVTVILAGGSVMVLRVSGNAKPMSWPIVGIVMSGLGVVLVVTSIIVGSVMGRQGKNAETVHLRDALVVARFAIDEEGEMVFQDFDAASPKTKLFVHLKLPGGQNQEFGCCQEVFDKCGEGMRGSAIVKGDWLGGFAAFPVQPRTPFV